MRLPNDDIEKRRLNERGKQILQRKAGKAVRPYREDGYVNLLNKYGTTQDNSEAYNFQREPIIPDMQLTSLYEGNGLFTKIIDTPAEEALKHGFDLNLNSEELDVFVEEALDELEWEEKAATAIKWARLYGGAIIVMLIDDGRGLEEPVDWKNIRSIDELRVYERAIVEPDYTSLYIQDWGGKGTGNRVSKFGQPEFYYVSSIYGSFIVHESRCLVFRNGVLPEQSTNATYRFWGMPEYVRIRRALRETITAHTDSTKLLERSVQAIYSMKGLAQMLSTDDGENNVLKRLQVIDMARGLLNSIAIDSDGENYDFKTFQFSGVKDVIDATCNMLSALTNIPQTILFGRSPAGMNATGDSDFESYYNFVERIQKLMLKRNLRELLDVVFRAGVASGEISEEPGYKLKFNPLWSLSETERATVEQTKAQTAQIKAQTAQTYVDMQALDPTEVRRRLSADEDFNVEDIITEDDDLLDALMDEPDTVGDVEAAMRNVEEQKQPGGSEQAIQAKENLTAQNVDGLTVPPRTAIIYLDDDGDWVTINGTHVLLGEGGSVAGGPPNLKGKTFSRAKSQKKAVSTTKNSELSGKKPEVRGSVSVSVSSTDSKNLKKYAKRNSKEAPEIIDSHKEYDQQVREKFGETQMTTEEFVQKSMTASEKWSEEDRMLDAAYTTPIVGKENPLGIKYSELNRKLRNGESLTDNEQAVVDHFARCAEPIGKDTDLYRMVEKDYVESILASTGTSDVEQLAGKTVKNEALQSTCVGVSSFFKSSDVAIKIKTPANIPVCMTSDISEGEIVIPAGAKMRITSVKTIKQPTVSFARDEKNRPIRTISADERIDLPSWSSARNDRGMGVKDPKNIAKHCGYGGAYGRISEKFAGVYIEMELVGYE